MTRVFPAVLLVFLGFASVSRALAADVTSEPTPAATAPFARFQQVGSNLYRGGQPDANGFAFLRNLGIKTVVSLREDDTERKLVESLGMRFVHIPVSFHFLGGEMPDEAVTKFMTTVDDPANGPIFLHCRRGADRTGAFVALYRMVRQGWDLDRAYSEARDLGMRWWFLRLKSELTAVARLITSAPASAVQ